MSPRRGRPLPPVDGLDGLLPDLLAVPHEFERGVDVPECRDAFDRVGHASVDGNRRTEDLGRVVRSIVYDDRDDRLGADRVGRHDRAHSGAAAPEEGDARAVLDGGGVEDGVDTRRRPTAERHGRLEGGALVDGNDGLLSDDGGCRERRLCVEVVDRSILTSQPSLAVSYRPTNRTSSADGQR